MKLSKIACITLAAALAARVPFADDARAALQGTLGTTSNGSLNFSVTKPPRADISNLTDLQLAGWIVGDGAVTMTEDVCVYSTRPSGGYTVLAAGSGAGQDFTLSNGGATLPYQVSWNAGGVGNLSNTGTPLTSNVASAGFTHAATDSSSCSGAAPGPTARLIVYVSNGQMSSAPSGSYSGTLTLVVTPN
jgi:hypothetical protein